MVYYKKNNLFLINFELEIMCFYRIRKIKYIQSSIEDSSITYIGFF